MLFALADRGVNLEMDDCRQWVRSRLQESGCKPFEFVRTASCYDPSQSNFDGSFAGISFYKSYILNIRLRIVQLVLWLKKIFMFMITYGIWANL